MIKWAVCGEKVDAHAQRLSDYLNSAGVKNEVSAFSIGKFNFKSETASGVPTTLQLPQDMSWLRFPFRMGDQIFPHLERITQECRELKYCDGVMMDKGRPWPRVGLSHALTRTFSEFSFVDATKGILIVGAGGRARVAASAAVTLGFKHVVFVSTDEGAMHESVATLKRTHFATRFETISSEKLIEVASAFSVCIFANDNMLTESFRTELSFFNFMTPDGVVVDVSHEMANAELDAAAKEANVRVVSAEVPLSFLDSTWVEWVFHHELDLVKYREFSAGTLEVVTADFQSDGQ